ncbi:MAG TPA: TerB family tellurite resistance protein [Myxococcaceae bacterium]|nr:TerB family tellurite resistance protein [Myxococcaceae bacterium]
MTPGKAGWLTTLLSEALSAHEPARDLELLGGALPSGSPRAQARAFLRRALRESGLLYGTPTTPAEGSAGLAREEVLFVAVVRTFARIALDIAAVVNAPKAPRHEQLLVLFAAFTGLRSEAADADKRLRKSPSEPLPKRLWSRVETALEQRAVSLSGDPAYGLVLHNGALYADAHAFGRQAIDYFVRGHFAPEGARRRFEMAARQKAQLVEVLTALWCVESAPSFSARRAILRQIEDLRLPSKLESGLRERVKRAFERRPKLSAVVKGVKSRDMRLFIVEQTLLASLVDGHRSPQELAFIQELAEALGIPKAELKQVEVQVAEFYARNRSVVDVFTLSPGAEVMGEEVVESIQRTVEKNFNRLMVEVKETGELSLLLGKAARGHKLSSEEKAKMRAQLIDIAKAIPALAIFAAPGGLLLLVALAKVLPFNLLPSAFQDEPEEGSSTAPGAGATAGVLPEATVESRKRGVGG